MSDTPFTTFTITKEPLALPDVDEDVLARVNEFVAKMAAEKLSILTEAFLSRLPPIAYSFGWSDGEPWVSSLSLDQIYRMPPVTWPQSIGQRGVAEDTSGRRTRPSG